MEVLQNLANISGIPRKDRACRVVHRCRRAKGVVILHVLSSGPILVRRRFCSAVVGFSSRAGVCSGLVVPPVRRCAWFHPGPGRWWCSVPAVAKSARVDRGRYLSRCIPSARAGGWGLSHRRAATYPTHLYSGRGRAGENISIRKSIRAASPPGAGPCICRASRNFWRGVRSLLARYFGRYLLGSRSLLAR